MKPVFLGMNSPDDGFETLDPSRGAGRRLSEIVGRDAFEEFDRSNVLERRVWSRIWARRRADEVVASMKDRVVVVLGQEAWSALALPTCNWFESKDHKDATWWRVPHTSGRSRMYNSERNRIRLRFIIRRILWGQPMIQSSR